MRAVAVILGLIGSILVSSIAIFASWPYEISDVLTPRGFANWAPTLLINLRRFDTVGTVIGILGSIMIALGASRLGSVLLFAAIGIAIWGMFGPGLATPGSFVVVASTPLAIAGLIGMTMLKKS